MEGIIISVSVVVAILAQSTPTDSLKIEILSTVMQDIEQLSNDYRTIIEWLSTNLQARNLSPMLALLGTRTMQFALRSQYHGSLFIANVTTSSRRLTYSIRAKETARSCAIADFLHRSELLRRQYLHCVYVIRQPRMYLSNSIWAESAISCLPEEARIIHWRLLS